MGDSWGKLMVLKLSAAYINSRTQLDDMCELKFKFCNIHKTLPEKTYTKTCYAKQDFLILKMLVVMLQI